MWQFMRLLYRTILNVPRPTMCSYGMLIVARRRRPEYDGRAAQISIVTDEGSGCCQAGC